MRKLLAVLACSMSISMAQAQTYTNAYPKALDQLAQKWLKKGDWKNGFTINTKKPIRNGAINKYPALAFLF